MSGFRWFKPRPAVVAGQNLFEGAVNQARSPAFYEAMGVADSVLGRFELYTLHVVLLAERLGGKSAEAREVCQAMFDAYLLNLDIALREMGVGDLSMGKKMKKLGQAFYGRMKSWEAARGDTAAERALIARTVYEGGEGAHVGPLLDYMRAARAALGAQSDAALIGEGAAWPAVTS